ncbi:MAG: 1-acyl-sn-glycerol-3-phosphate acyltransferase [Alphaproteobacteria bacterium]|nr:1-acyl-sn-glycerol-3-phosphate acyltransferase [Alphaproteobacteria bacterium]
MPQDAPTADDARLAAFIGPETHTGHIVDILIEERCPSFVRHWTWPVVKPVLYALLGYRKARRWADDIKALPSGQACFAYLDKALELNVRVTGADRVPRTGRAVTICNHPTGLADGSAVLAAMTPLRTDIEILANADACRVNPKFADVIIPVEWVADKRTPAKTRETLRRASAAFAAERMLLIFPSGRLAHYVDGRLVDKGWYPTAVSLARKNKAPVTPLHLTAKNSWLYYRLVDLNGELRDITLFHELLNKQGDVFELTFGPQIPHEHLNGDPQAVADHLRDYVENVLPNDPEKPFEALPA